jgi:hypothetical protein
LAEWFACGSGSASRFAAFPVSSVGTLSVALPSSDGAGS